MYLFMQEAVSDINLYFSYFPCAWYLGVCALPYLLLEPEPAKVKLTTWQKNKSYLLLPVYRF
ncbi:hypothetical protein SAMN05720606_10496 [Paenibacillus polysaccharolyticus]|uniref:Uncharacterized protein n=1 Tax=Paenibacillus polysaccharolyticus TaxID=582692 RepID=A0A1G5F7V3_9BACL|nr:hypothetical protein SAMN05720606_10496 [Paenibacillus polysaccharolyticus]